MVGHLLPLSFLAEALPIVLLVGFGLFVPPGCSLASWTTGWFTPPDQGLLEVACCRQPAGVRSVDSVPAVIRPGAVAGENAPNPCRPFGDRSQLRPFWIPATGHGKL